MAKLQGGYARYLTTWTLSDGMQHYANHCASCHANDGSGHTEMGRGLYPRAPDMRLAATQDLSDGELFYVNKMMMARAIKLSTSTAAKK